MKKIYRLVLPVVGLLLMSMLIFSLVNTWHVTKADEKMEQRALVNEPTMLQTADTINPSESAQPTDVAQSKDVTQPTDSAQPTDFAQPTDSAQPIDFAQPTDLAKPTDSTNPTDSGQSANPVKAMGLSNVKVEESQIQFQYGSESGFAISRLEAATNAMKQLANEATFDSSNPKIVMHAINTGSGKSYRGYVTVSNLKRNYFSVNAMTGSVEESEPYARNTVNDMVWYRSPSKDGIVERVIQEDNMSAFDSIDLDLANPTDYEIIGGDTYSVKAHFYGVDYTLDMNREGNTLTIINQSKDKRNRRTSFLTITVPKKALLNKITTDCVSGNIALSEIQAGKIYIDCTSGNVKTQNCKVDGLSVDATSADIVVKDCDLGTFYTDTTSGNVELDQWSKGGMSLDSTSGTVHIKKLLGGNVTIDTTSGNISVDQMQDSKLSVGMTSGGLDIGEIVNGQVYADTTAGDYTIGAIKSGKLDFSSTNGSYKIGNVGHGGNIDIQVDTTDGDVNISCLGTQKEYSYDLLSTNGINRAGNKSKSDELSQEVSCGNTIYVENTHGDNTIKFK